MLKLPSQTVDNQDGDIVEKTAFVKLLVAAA